MTVQYELIYFPAIAFAEVSKALLTLADASWKYTAVSFEEWPAIKPTTPLGHLPILREFDPATGEKVFEVAESSAIETYLATKLGLNGKNAREAALIASVRGAYNDIREHAFRYFWTPNEEAKAAALEKLKETAGNTAAYLDKFIANNPTGSGYFVGDSLTVADITAYVWSVWSQAMDSQIVVTTDNTPHLVKLVERVEKHPKFETLFAGFEQRLQAQAKFLIEKAAAEKAAKEAAKAANDAAAANDAN
ncbi:glutathione S-transferase [Ramicandelaber brevisporus]|nr:glutathione S-transferase [Ramicandelaber brevisporus]